MFWETDATSQHCHVCRAQLAASSPANILEIAILPARYYANNQSSIAVHCGITLMHSLLPLLFLRSVPRIVLRATTPSSITTQSIEVTQIENVRAVRANLMMFC